MKKGSLILAILVGALSFGVAAYADTAWNTSTVYGSPVPEDLWSGYYVQYDSGISATQGWANENTTLSWNIYPELGDRYFYSYSWSADAGELSHIIIELTPGTTIERGLEQYYGVEYPSPEKGVWDTDGNPLLPYGFYGAKITLGGVLEFSFTSEQEPVWGNFYAKDGGGMGEDAVVAWNTGLGSNVGVFIARPDGNGEGVPAVPEPGTLLLLGAGLLGLWGVPRRK
jgi:hypothetical protein